MRAHEQATLDRYKGLESQAAQHEREASAARATDLHIEPARGHVIVRHRVDGLLEERERLAAIEREPAKACVPAWPWVLVGWFMRNAPLSWVSKVS